jgi:acetolactate synthase-1/2/3 large subunit
MIAQARRPVLIFGAGIRLAKAKDAAIKFAEHLGIPVLLTWGGKELLAHEHPLNMGTVGVCGPRAGNFAAQNADFVLGLGTRFCQMVTGGKQNLFAPHAKKVMVDIDPEEFTKFTENDFKLDFSIHGDLKDFLGVCERLYGKKENRFVSWCGQIKTWQKKYPVCTPDLSRRFTRVNGLVFLKELSAFAKEGDVIVADTGANLAWTMQAFEVKKDQRIISAWNHTPMGYALPASAGAALAAGRDIICITGDGGIMMSLEELGTIRRHNLPVKIFIMFNHGHGIQRQTMDTWLNSRYTGVDEASGLYFPDFGKVAAGFRLPFVPVRNHREIRPALKKVFGTNGPVVCCVEIVKDERIVPMLKFGAGLEDLDPKLPPEELAAIMKISGK